ncbi:MAG: GTP-binding protein [Planctomycetota bacterium]
MRDVNQMASTQETRTPVLILNGFLGSGKTTLLRSLLVQSHKKQLTVGVVVNDMSELDVDGLVVAQTEFFDKNDGNFESIHACVLSSKKGIQQLHHALERMLAESRSDLLIIETSGSCHPMPLIEFFRAEANLRLTGVLTLVDSAMIDQDYDGGKQIFPIMQRNLKDQRRDTTNLLVEQIMFCSHLMLTKVDRIAEGKLQAIAQAVHELNPFVSVASIPFGNLPIDDVLAMPEYDYHRVAQLIEELKPTFESESSNDRPYNLATRVIKDDRPFHPQRLWDTCQQHLGQHIYRSKGFFYLSSRDNVSLLWNQAAGGISLELVGYWRAGILEDPNHGLDEMEVEGLKKRLENEAGRFGDRRCHLTVIGDKTQVDYFAESLKRCFLSEDEIRHWQSGGEFPDPWPDSFVTRNY